MQVGGVVSGGEENQFSGFRQRAGVREKMWPIRIEDSVNEGVTELQSGPFTKVVGCS